MKTPVIASIVLTAAIFAGSGTAFAGDRHESYRNPGIERQHRDHGFREDIRRHREMAPRHHFERRRDMHRHHHARWAKRHHHRHDPRWHGHYHRQAMRPARVEVYTHHHAAPVVAGAVIGGAIANHVSYGDPGATVAGAMMGAVLASGH